LFLPFFFDFARGNELKRVASLSGQIEGSYVGPKAKEV
jgi:hypothetical protein